LDCIQRKFFRPSDGIARVYCILSYCQKIQTNKKDDRCSRDKLAQEINWHYILLFTYVYYLCLCTYDKKNNEKVIVKYLFYNIDSFPKFYLNQTSTYYNKKNREI